MIDTDWVAVYTFIPTTPHPTPPLLYMIDTDWVAVSRDIYHSRQLNNNKKPNTMTVHCAAKKIGQHSIVLPYDNCINNVLCRPSSL
jgi:hypothetical protein